MCLTSVKFKQLTSWRQSYEDACGAAALRCGGGTLVLATPTLTLRAESILVGIVANLRSRSFKALLR